MERTGMDGIPAEQIREGDLVNLTGPLHDSRVRPWVHQPFGDDAGQLADAVDTARMTAEHECAIADPSTVNADGSVNVYTDMINLVVPAGYQMEVERDL